MIIASVDIKIITESDELHGTTGDDFSEPVKISVNIAQNAEYKYDRYNLSVSAANLPEGFSLDGDAENIPIDQQETTVYINGLSDSSFTEDIVISAFVTILGDAPTLITSADHTVKIAILSDVLTGINISMDSQAVSGNFTEGFAASMDLSNVLTDVTGSFIDGTSRSIKAESEITFSSTSLPEGFSIESSALSIAEYVAAGTYSIPVTIMAKNRGLSASSTENISVIISPFPTIEITTAEFASGKIAQEFSASLSAVAIVNGEETAITPVWTLVDGALPSGLALSSDGKISGVPEEIGAFDFVVQASAEVVTVDGHNIALSSDKDFTMLIAAAEEDIDVVSCEVSLSGSNAITLTEGTSGSLTLTPVVTATYEDGSVRFLAPDEYSASWTINTAFLAAYRMSFSNGTLTISDTTAADTYNIAVGVNISVGSLTAEAGAYFNVVVYPRESQPGTSSPDQQDTRDVVINVEGDSVVLVVNNNSGSTTEQAAAFAELVENLSQAEKELITDIDLSQNTTITDLTGLADFKNVSTINATGCEALTTVDVSGCDKLEYLDVSSCDIDSLLVDGC